MSVTNTDFTPPQTTAGRRRRRMRRGLVGVGVTVAVVGAAAGTQVVVSALHRCGAGVTRQGDECVGVTDGSYVFDPALATVEGQIRAENHRVEDRPHVTVALLTPLTSSAVSTVSIERIRSQLEGAYVAQHSANSSGSNPRIRLVLANMGSQEQAWEPVVDQLADMVNGPQHLVTVIGMGVSSDPTVRAAKALAGHGIPMVGAVITGDGLNTTATGLGGPIPGLTRVNPSVGDELAVLAEYLTGHRRDLHTALLVGDENSSDLYTGALQRDFTTTGLSRYWVDGGRVVQPYDGTPGTPGTDAQFRAIVANLCGVNPPDMVFYAGRASLLPTFVARLRQRNCARDRTVTVVTGSDASALAASLPRPQAVDAPVTVVYAPLVDPNALANRRFNPDLAQYQRFADTFTRVNGFPADDLADGWAIMTHDAMLAATLAIGRATGQSSQLPAPGDVRSLLYLANSPTTSVPGAGGTFTFDPKTGDAVGRRIPVMELRPDGSLTVLGTFPQPRAT